MYGHVAGGLEAADKLTYGSSWLWFRQWVYLFHMPAFFALSGLLAPKLLECAPFEFFLNRLRNIYFPYVVWTAIIFGSQVSMARYVNHPPDLMRALAFVIEPYGYGLWFLYSLFLISTLYYALSYLKPNPSVMVLLSLLLSYLAGRNVFGFWPILNTASSYFVYFALPACASRPALSLFSPDKWLVPLVCGILAFSIMSLIYLKLKETSWFLSLSLAWLGIVGVVCLAHVLAQTWGNQLWAILGFYSLEIYLGHPLWGTLARAVMLRVRIESVPVLILNTVLIAVAGSLVIGMACRKFNFPYLFKWPQKRLPSTAVAQA